MSYANLTGTSIRRATVRGVQLDDIAARRSTERLLGRIPDAVPGMSASAILCVRELSIRVRSKPSYMQSSGSVLHDEMEQLARRAARPAHGPVPSHAEAVLFADRAELLSCLARDHVRHLLEQHWWWRVLLPEADIIRAAVQLWVNEAAHAPAALARLARTRDAQAFVRALGDAEASAVVQAMVRSHGLALLAEESAVESVKQSRSQSISPTLSKLPHDDELDSLYKMERVVRAALPEAWSPGLTVMQRQLLAVGLSLVRLPGLVRSSAYAKVLFALLVQAATRDAFLVNDEHTVDRKAPAQSFPLSSSLTPAGERAIFPSPAIVSGAGRGVPESNTQDTFMESDGHVVDRDSPVQSSPQIIQISSHRRRPVSSLNKTLDSGLRRNDESLMVPNSGATSLSKPVFLSSAEQPVALHADAELKKNAVPCLITPGLPTLSASLLEGKAQSVQTQYGGVFFLCNAALALGLYPDFTRPLDRGLELSLWDFLALAAVDLGGPAVRQDPLWPLLAEFAGRVPGQRPGTGFALPGEWRLPVKWLLPFAGNTANWTWEADAARLVVRHPAGFVVLDLLRTDMTAEEQLRVELAQYAMPGINQTQHRRAPVTPLARWRGWLMTYLGRRVARALGDKRWRHACRQMLCLPARIECDAERLDVYFSLEQLPIAVRMAGLDRDPGWIPAAGRDLRLHFGCAHD